MKTIILLAFFAINSVPFYDCDILGFKTTHDPLHYSFDFTLEQFPHKYQPTIDRNLKINFLMNEKTVPVTSYVTFLSSQTYTPHRYFIAHTERQKYTIYIPEKSYDEDFRPYVEIEELNIGYKRTVPLIVTKAILDGNLVMNRYSR